VHCTTLNVGDRDCNVTPCYTAQPDWQQEEIDIAFQMDGYHAQEPYSVWLDEVNY